MLKCFILIDSKIYKGLLKSSEHFDLPDRLFHRQITTAYSNVLNKATVKKLHFLFAVNRRTFTKKKTWANPRLGLIRSKRGMI